MVAVTSLADEFNIRQVPRPYETPGARSDTFAVTASIGSSIVNARRTDSGSPNSQSQTTGHLRVEDTDVNKMPLAVHRFGDIDYVHFACSGPTRLTIRRLDASTVNSCRVRPTQLGITAAPHSDSVEVMVFPRNKLVVNVDHLRKLFVFVELDDRQDVPEGHKRIDIVQRGADPSGQRDSTEVIQSTIDALDAGDELYFPPGCYRTGSLRLKSDMTLRLAGGAILKGTDDHRRYQFFRDGSYLYFLLIDGLKNVRIIGPGTIDANGYIVRRKWQEAKGVRKQPGRLLLCVDSQNIEVRDVILRDSFSWTAHLVNCDECEIGNVKILADTRNSNVDGLDVDGCRRLTAEDLFIYAEDDAISVKAAWCHENPRDLAFRNCILWSQNATGIRVGTETEAEAFRRMVFENTSILRANTMVRIFCHQGAHIEDVAFRDFWMEELSMYAPNDYEEFRRIAEVTKGVTYLLQLQVRKEKGKGIGTIQDVLFENVKAQVGAGSKIKGYDAPAGTTLIRNVTVRNLKIEDQWVSDATTGRFSINDYVKGVRFEVEEGVSSIK